MSRDNIRFTTPSPLISGPVFTLTPAKSQRVTAGDTVVLYVVVDAEPHAEVTWFTPGGPAANMTPRVKVCGQS